ncbi:MAG: hypothetical protein M1814_001757 [Vezdaea aestivalis]|nr:MAG: hypothetical protein M1814_001757 [Vezdaea aestivalis]
MAPSSSTVSKLKVQLKLSISRLRMIQQKDIAIAKQQRRAMAQLLEQGRIESAKIRVENIIRSDISTELLEILELYCELLSARIGLLEGKECDIGLEEAVKSIIHAAPRTDIKELQTTRQLLMEKFGKEFALEAVENSDGKVAERVMLKLSLKPPPEELVLEYLKEIAKTYGIDWPKQEKNGDDEESGEEEDDDPRGGRAIKELAEPLKADELTKATPPRDFGPKSPVSVAPPSSSSDNVSPKVKLPVPPDLKPGPNMAGNKKLEAKKAVAGSKSNDTPPKKPNAVGGKIPDVDELASRFAALKR